MTQMSEHISWCGNNKVKIIEFLFKIIIILLIFKILIFGLN